MFERFTDQARGVVVRAQDVARATGADRIEPVHLFLAVAVGDGVGGTVLRDAGLDADRARTAAQGTDATVLGALGVDLELVRSRVEATFGDGALDPRSRPGHLRFSPAAKRSLQETLRSAVGLGERRLDDGHVLLGVLAVRDVGVAAVLADQDVDPLDLRRRLIACRAA